MDVEEEPREVLRPFSRLWKRGKRILSRLKMSPNSRRPLLVLYLVCCAALTTILSSRGTNSTSGSVVLIPNKESKHTVPTNPRISAV